MENQEELKEPLKEEKAKPPRHERFQVNRVIPPDQPMRVRILGPTDIFVTEDVKSLQVNLPDGKMSICRRYSSVIEKIKEGEIKLNLAYPENSKQEKKFYISSGWMITSYNLCELLVKSCKETT